MPGIVVGVDGSGHSRQVLEWAVKEAALRNTSLTVLTVKEVFRSAASLTAHSSTGPEYSEPSTPTTIPGMACSFYKAATTSWWR